MFAIIIITLSYKFTLLKYKYKHTDDDNSGCALESWVWSLQTQNSKPVFQAPIGQPHPTPISLKKCTKGYFGFVIIPF